MLKNNSGIGLRIIDENILLYAGGVFRKGDKLNNVESQTDNTNVKDKSNERENSEVMANKLQIKYW